MTHVSFTLILIKIHHLNIFKFGDKKEEQNKFCSSLCLSINVISINQIYFAFKAFASAVISNAL